MLTKILTAFDIVDPGSLKRFAVGAVTGVIALTINPLLASKGLPQVSQNTIDIVVGLVIAYLLQSGAVALTEAHGQAKVDVAQAQVEVAKIQVASLQPGLFNVAKDGTQTPTGSPP